MRGRIGRGWGTVFTTVAIDVFLLESSDYALAARLDER
jgi:hypothetical protein